MSGPQEETEKTLDPSPKKLLEARRKGDVPKSTDLFVAAGYAGIFAVMSIAGGGAVITFATMLSVLLDRSAQLSTIVFSGAQTAPMGGIFRSAGMALAPLFAAPACAVLLCVLAQRAFVVAPEKLQPKLSRISMISNAKNKFGRAGLFEFAKSALKLLIYATCLGFFLNHHADRIIGAARADPMSATALMARLAVSFMLIAALVAASIGTLDLIFQHAEHRRKNMMSRKEMQDEHKQDEGDPHMKSERRRRAIAIANNRMLADVPGADVVVVNPTHYAVALSWDRAPGAAPTCVAKGLGDIAFAIRERAAEAGVPIHSDPPTARALYASTEIGEQVAPEHYGPVAAAIRFAEDMRRRMRAGR